MSIHAQAQPSLRGCCKRKTDRDRALLKKHLQLFWGTVLHLVLSLLTLEKGFLYLFIYLIHQSYPESCKGFRLSSLREASGYEPSIWLLKWSHTLWNETDILCSPSLREIVVSKRIFRLVMCYNRLLLVSGAGLLLTISIGLCAPTADQYSRGVVSRKPCTLFPVQ